MAKRRHQGDAELPFVALMDTMTNVVGVLIIVLVMVGISIASAVKKVLSELPSVDASTFEQLQKELADNTKRIDPAEIEKQKEKLEQDVKKSTEELTTLDLSADKQKVKFVDLDDLQKQIQANKYNRDKSKTETEKVIAELDKMKALLDQTPVYVPPAATVIRLPNPRPYPAKPNETRVLIAERGALYFNQADFLAPILDGLEKSKSQLQFQSAKYDPFAKLLEGVFGSKPAAVAAWPEVGALIGTFQLEPVAQAYKALADAGFPPNKQYLLDLGEIALGLSTTLPAVAAAVADAAAKGDFTKWLALDPGLARGAPLIKAAKVGNKIHFAWSTAAVEVRAAPKDILDYFKDLSEHASFKDRSKTLFIYDNTRIQAALQRAASNPTFSKGFAFQPTFTPGATFVTLGLTPAAGGGEALEVMKQQGSNYQRLLRQLKTDPNAVVVFQVLPAAFQTYHEARRIADEIGVPATWEFLAKLDISLPLTTFQVQRMIPATTAKPKPPAPAGTAPTVVIKPPPKSLD